MSFLSIAIIDDDSEILKTLIPLLQKEGHQCDGFFSYKEFSARAVEKSYELLFLDINLGDGVPGGLFCLPEIKEKYADLDVVMITGNVDISAAVKSLQAGASDFLEKPLHYSEIIRVLKNRQEARVLGEERDRLAEGILKENRLLGNSARMKELRKQLALWAPLKEPVLITGESGTGKELAASALHYSSPRKGNPYVTVNAGAFTESLLESQLFGHRKGAFTGADFDARGMIISAGKGSLFFDEIGEMKSELQTRLLRVIQEREVVPVGGVEPEICEARFLFATNRLLEEEIRSGRFREDLYYRISTLHIEIPPLRERRDDIPLLAEKIMNDFCQENGLSTSGFSSSALDRLCSFSTYPGNIRELKNIVIRARLRAGDKILPEHITAVHNASEEGSFFGESLPFAEMKKKLEKKYIETQLQKFDGNRNKTAEALGLLPNNLSRKISELGIKV